MLSGFWAPAGVSCAPEISTLRLPVAASYLMISDPPLARSTVVYDTPSASHRAGPKRGSAYSFCA